MTGLIESLKISTSPYINAILSVLLFIVVAKFIDIFVDKVLRRIARVTKSDLDDKIIDIIHRPIYLTIILIGCILAIIYLNPSTEAIFYTNNILYSLISVIWTFTIIRLSRVFIDNTIYKISDVTGFSKDIGPLIENVVKIAIITCLSYGHIVNMEGKDYTSSGICWYRWGCCCYCCKRYSI
jgi:MscS family membrane protein